MEILEKELKILLEKMRKETNDKYQIDDKVLENLPSGYPFNKVEYIFCHLLATHTININQYLEMRNSYLQRNKYLHVFEITAPRTFGETWGQKHLREMFSELKKPSKKYDPEYSGQYDLWYEGIKIEVKASRAVKKESGRTLVQKALLSTSKEAFNMNFQQSKPKCCDVFVWIAVWRDKIRYWVLTSDEVKNNGYFSVGQHRGNVGEGQLWVTDKNINEFRKYEVNDSDILEAIKKKYMQSKQKAAM